METSNFRSELHVAQQSRREKLRVLQHHHHHHHPNPDQNVEIYGANHLDQFSAGQQLEGAMNPDLVNLRSFRYGNLSYEPATVFSSDMLQYFAANSQALLAHQESDKRIAAGGGGGGGSGDAAAAASASASFGNLSHNNSNNNTSNIQSNNTNSSGKIMYSGDPQNCSPWKSIAGGDWVSCSTYNSGSAAAGGIGGNHSNPVFVAEGLKINNNTSSSSSPAISTVYMKQQHPLINYGYQDLRSSSSLTVPSGEIIANHSHHNNSQLHFYHNNSNNATATTTVVQSQNVRDTGRVSNWSHSGNELVLLPAYADHCNAIDYSESKATGGAGGGCRGLGTIANDNSNTQGLSLSLSSAPSSKQHFGGGGGGGLPPEKPADYLCTFNVKPPPPTSSYGGGKGCMENVDTSNVVGNSSAFAQRGSGPLGPFTGYATILKSSRFLRPAQQLMDEFCNILAPKSLNMLEKVSSDKISAGNINVTPSCDGFTGAESLAGVDSGNNSSTTFFSSNEKMMRESAGLSSSNESYKPEYLQKKAKLLYMQDEVCKRYKNYHQQMEMVVSSFETVAGLSAATPYLSLALKTVSRHFRSLKNAISDQIRNVRKALGEDLSSLTTGTSCSKGGDSSSSRQKVIDQTLQKQKTVSAGGYMGFFEPQQQHVWRPQRGLPERAVAILRAWLFDHFLHPYPTDADKHMLASQTGLTRNQVSNWFINARVRVWKPMVEEIHTLETKGGGGMGEAGPSGGKTEGKVATEVIGGSHRHHSNDSQALMNRLSDKQQQQQQASAECSEMISSTFTVNRLMNTTTNTTTNETTWDDDDQEKRSRLLECRIPGGGTTTTMDGSLVGFMPYQQSGIDIGGLGAVSLTLGLRQNNAAEGVQHESQLRRHFGDHIIYDFVG